MIFCRPFSQFSSLFTQLPQSDVILVSCWNETIQKNIELQWQSAQNGSSPAGRDVTERSRWYRSVPGPAKCAMNESSSEVTPTKIPTHYPGPSSSVLSCPVVGPFVRGSGPRRTQIPLTSFQLCHTYRRPHPLLSTHGNGKWVKFKLLFRIAVRQIFA